MNYKKNYEDYACYVRSLNRRKGDGNYYEEHHIYPRCLGGTDDQENLILLTAREHFLAHYLLCRMYEKDSQNYPKLLNAFAAMTFGGKSLRYFNGRLFERLKSEYSIACSQRMLGKRIQPVGYTHSEETRNKMSRARQGKKPALGLKHSEATKERLRHVHDDDILMWNDELGEGAWVSNNKVEEFLSMGYRRGGHPNSEAVKERFLAFSKTPRSDQHKKAISAALKGVAKSPEAVKKMKQTRLANKKPVSEETRKKHSANASGRIWIHKEGKSKMCKKDQLESFLQQGWRIGRHEGQDSIPTL